MNFNFWLTVWSITNWGYKNYRVAFHPRICWLKTGLALDNQLPKIVNHFCQNIWKSDNFITVFLHLTRHSRNPNQPAPDHGQIGAGPVRAVQPGDRPRRTGGRDQQETLAGDHQGTASAVEHYQRGLHAEDTVSFVYFVLSLSLALHFMSFGNVTGWLRPMNGVDKFRVAVVDTQTDWLTHRPATRRMTISGRRMVQYRSIEEQKTVTSDVSSASASPFVTRSYCRPYWSSLVRAVVVATPIDGWKSVFTYQQGQMCGDKCVVEVFT